MTGREAIEKVTESLIVAEKLSEMGFVCVPRQPTQALLDAAWAEALAENAAGVWDMMIGVSEGKLTAEGIPVSHRSTSTDSGMP